MEPTTHNVGSSSKDSSNGIHAKNATLTTTTSSSSSSSSSGSSGSGSSKAFDSQVRITFRGISELMDGDAAKALEDTTFTFLNDQFMDMMLVREVTLSSQSVTESTSSEPVRALRRVRSNSSVKSMLRTRSMADISSPSTSLIVELSVEGVITNWNDFISGDDDIQDIDEDFISTVLSQSIMVNSSEFMDRLAEESEFFPSATPRSISSVVTDPASSSSSDEGKGRKVFLILGVVVAAIAMVGAFYMELKSGAKRRRGYACDGDNQDANFGEDLVVESGSGQEAFEISCGSLRSVSLASGNDNENPPSDDGSSCQLNSVKDSIDGGGAAFTGEGKHMMQGDESMLMKEARIRTYSLQSVDKRYRGYDAYVKKLDDVMIHAEEEEDSRSYNKQEEVNHASMMSTLASAVDTTTRVNSGQHRSGNSVEKQEVVAAESGEESSSHSDEDRSCQKSDEDSEVESCQRSRNMKPTHRDNLTTEKKSSRMQKPKRKSHRQRYEGMEHSAYEVVLQNH